MEVKGVGGYLEAKTRGPTAKGAVGREPATPEPAAGSWEGAPQGYKQWKSLERGLSGVEGKRAGDRLRSQNIKTVCGFNS